MMTLTSITNFHSLAFVFRSHCANTAAHHATLLDERVFEFDGLVGVKFEFGHSSIFVFGEFNNHGPNDAGYRHTDQDTFNERKL